MKVFKVLIVIELAISFPQVYSVQSHPKKDFARECYGVSLPDLPAPPDNRTAPWGAPSIWNGKSTCCSSLEEVRTGIDAIDVQFLELLSRRAAFVREATRFKATHGQVDVPSRDEQVVEEAVSAATAVHLPQTIAQAVFKAIINASVSFEFCVFDSFHQRGH